MSRPILNIKDLEFHDVSHEDRFAARMGIIGSKIGAHKLGYNLTVLPPGKRAFPFHSHRVNEEMFFVLEGQGEVRIGENRHAIGPGDVIACPPGGPDTAHQIANTSDTDELRYLAVSTMLTPEIAEYPDSGKFAILAKYPTGTDGETERWTFVGRPDGGLDYWDGE